MIVCLLSFYYSGHSCRDFLGVAGFNRPTLKNFLSQKVLPIERRVNVQVMAHRECNIPFSLIPGRECVALSVSEQADEGPRLRVVGNLLVPNR